MFVFCLRKDSSSVQFMGVHQGLYQWAECCTQAAGFVFKFVSSKI